MSMKITTCLCKYSYIYMKITTSMMNHEHKIVLVCKQVCIVIVYSCLQDSYICRYDEVFICFYMFLCMGTDHVRKTGPRIDWPNPMKQVIRCGKKGWIIVAIIAINYYLPVTKCINVMVGITGSKVLFYYFYVLFDHSDGFTTFDLLKLLQITKDLQ